VFIEQLRRREKPSPGAMSQILDDKAAKSPKLSFLINPMTKQTTFTHIGYLDGLQSSKISEIIIFD
jgi:hypothetical protein